MRALALDRHGGPEVLRLVDRPEPSAGPGQVVVKVRAASANRIDHLIRSGTMDHSADFPLVLGKDFSGGVCSTADDVTDLQPGERVFGVCPVSQDGAYAERIAIERISFAHCRR